MKEFVEKLIGRLENRIKYNELCHKEFPNAKMSFTYEVQINAYKNAIEIVNHLAEEYNNGWISCERELPKYTGEYNVTVVVASELGSFEEVTTLRFENIKGKEPRWIIPKDEIYRVIAWQPLPTPYQKGE